MRAALVVFLLLFLANTEAWAAKTAQIVQATGKVQAIVWPEVQGSPPSGIVFVTISDDSPVEAGWIYDFNTQTFSAPGG
jgi:hypothetical protein